MNKIVLLAVLLALALASADTTYASQCPPQHIWDKGCVKLCTHPDFANCGDVFPAIFNPSFCALERSGRWRSETFACQACKDNNVVGVKTGKCGCQSEGCPSGQQCLNGACQSVTLPPVITPPVIRPPVTPSRCPEVPCPAGQRCTYNRCIPDDQQQSGVFCKNERDCKNYELCLDSKCVDRCAAIRCASGTRCFRGECIPQAECTADQQCRTGFKCNSQGKCINKCSDIICIATTRCVDGACVPLCENVNCPLGTRCVQNTGTCSPIPGFCASDASCNSSQVCRNGQCIDFCAVSTCPEGTACRGRQCVPIPGFCLNSTFCKSDEVCQNRQCVNFCAVATCPYGQACRGRECVPIDKCQLVRCPANTRCNNGICVPVEGFCLDSTHCPQNQICQNGRCVDRCSGVVCPQGSQCQSGLCVVVDNCAAVTCPTGYRCNNARCLPVYPQCGSTSDCRYGEACLSGTCVNLVDKCQGVKCPPGSQCLNGECKFNLNVCPTDAQYTVKTCGNPRPTLQTCPVLNYIVAPAPLICGVKSDGTRVNFVRDCEACLDNSIDYYFDVPCHSAPIVCDKNEECNGNSCSSFCRTSDDCPFDWQICGQNRCLDRCSVIRCANCKYGQCGFVPPSGNCRQDSDCSNTNWTCLGFKCVDQCWNVRCPAGFNCSKGQCIRAVPY